MMVTRFIAEISSNHNGDLDRALALIDAAADSGCWGVKFQLFRIDKLFHESALSHPDYQFIHDRREWELPLDWLPVLSVYARQRGLSFGVTPFYLEAVDELLPFVDWYKVASYSLLHTALLAAVAATGKPVILSTGMATIAEVRQAVDVLEGCKSLTLLHCVSTYPALADQIYPAFYGELRRLAGVDNLGWSDHTVSPTAIYFFAIRRWCDVIEFHLDLDGQGEEYELGHCWLPEQIKPVIDTVKAVRAIGKAACITDLQAWERLWRADPADGLRPLMEMRERLCRTN